MESEIIRVTTQAHDALPRLAVLIAGEKGIIKLTLLETASIAILEALTKREKELEHEPEH